MTSAISKITSSNPVNDNYLSPIRNYSFSILVLLVFLFVSGPLLAANKRGTDISQALASGKSVLIAESGTFNPESDIQESIQIPGSYRPPLTYWIQRSTQKTLILGAADSNEGHGKVLTNRHYYYILEPGLYDFAGYVKKERQGNLNQLQRATGTIKSSIGFVNFSQTTLPSFYTYEKWVPAQSNQITFEGQTLAQWYSPGYNVTHGTRRQTNGIFVDMRGLVPNAPDGQSNIGSFLLEPGKIVVVPDFKMDFTNGPCDKPAEGQWVCPLTSLSLSTAFTPQHNGVRELMTHFKYNQELVNKVDSGYLVPGYFFKNKKMERDTQSSTVTGQPYGKFRVTLVTMPKPDIPAGK